MDLTKLPNKTTKDTTMDKVLQGVAPLWSERPEECNSGALKTRVRYSGAARRRYKKQLQKEGGATKAQIPPAEADSSPGPSSGGAPTVALKRARPGNNTPSPIDTRQGKRPKINDQASYAQATKGLVKLALILEGFPDKKLGTADCGLIRKMIRGRILELPEGTKAPIFSGSWERDGAFVFVCDDEQSGDWLKSLSSDLKVGGNSLPVVPVDELPRRHRVVVHVEEPDLSAEEAWRRLGR